MLTGEQRNALKGLILLLISKKLSEDAVDEDKHRFFPKWRQILKEMLEGNLAHCREIWRTEKNAFMDLCSRFKNKGSYRIILIHSLRRIWRYSL